MLFNVNVKAKTADEAWLYLFDMMTNDVEKKNSRDGVVVSEILNASVCIEDPTRCIMLNKVRKMPIRYAVGELLWYISARPTLNAIRKYTSAWDRMSDDGVIVNSNYGYCMFEKFGFNQYEHAKQLLKDNPETRQAVIHIKEARNLIDHPTKDVNCTVCLQFFIRDGKLYMTTYMRSNDMWMGFPYDVFQFSALQVLMSMELGCELGSYTHIAGSLHLYERDYEKAMQNIEKAENSEVCDVRPA